MGDVADSPRYALLEAARAIWQRRADDAVAVLEGLAGRMPAAVDPIRLRYLASAHLLAGRTSQASVCADEARRAAHLVGDVEEEIRATAQLGRIGAEAVTNGDLKAAQVLLDRCVRACDEGAIVDDLFLFGCLVDLGAVLGKRGQIRPALAALERALVVSARFNEPLLLAELYNSLAEAHRARGDPDTAVMYKQKCVQVHEELALQERIVAAVDHARRLSSSGAGQPTIR